jgi:uncharacterized delta-60 repeat protein
MRWAWARALLPWLTVGLAVITLPRFSGVTHAQHSPGEADLSFGDHGLVVTDLGGNDVVYAIAIQADGKIVAAGQTERGGNVDIALARYNPDGSLDRTFGRGGIVITDLGGADTAFAVNVERAAGRIVVAGVKDSDFALLRYNGDGSLDGSFGSGGVVTVPVVSDDPAVLYALALEADGRIVVAGTAGFVLARFSPDGSLDPTFGDGGLVPTAGGGGVLALAVGLPGADTIRVLTVSRLAWALTQYHSDGTVDLSYGRGGSTAGAFVGGLAGVYALDFEPGGNVIVAGVGGGRHAVARYTTDLELDPTFGTGGVAALDLGPGSIAAYAIRVVADGKYVLGGTVDGNFALARFEGVVPGGVLVKEDFNGTTGLLDDESPDPANYQLLYQGGEYVIRKAAAYNRVPSSYIPGVYADTSVAIDVRLVGPVENRYVALGCRQNPVFGQDGYRFTIDTMDRSFRIARWDQNGETILVNDYFSPLIRAGNERNRIELTCTGNVIAASVNGQRIGAVQDTTFRQGRTWLGVGVYAGSSGTAEARFDNLVMTRLLPFDPGTVILRDSGDSAATGLFSEESFNPQCCRFSYTGGEFSISKIDPQFERVPTSYVPGWFTDVTLAVDLRVVGPFQGRYVALGCRDTPSQGGSNQYRFSIDPEDGYYTLALWVQGQETILDEGASPAIRTGNQVNHIELSCIGTTISARVNGVTVTSVKDTTHGQGRLWIGTGVYRSSLPGTVDARFHNLQVILE